MWCQHVIRKSVLQGILRSLRSQTRQTLPNIPRLNATNENKPRIVWKKSETKILTLTTATNNIQRYSLIQ